MADLRNIRSSGVVVGGNVSRSTIQVGATGPVATDEAAVLRQIDALVTELLSGIGQLSPEEAGAAARDAVQVKAELGADQRDPGRIRAVLASLGKAVAACAPLAELAAGIAELAARLPH